MDWDSRYYSQSAYGHQEGYKSITEAAYHVQHQIPTDQTHCNKFIESFYFNGPKMLYELIAVENGDSFMRDYLESYVAYLIPIDPVAINKVKDHYKNIV